MSAVVERRAPTALVRWLAVGAALASTIGVTVLVEHRIHRIGAPAPEGEHEEEAHHEEGGAERGHAPAITLTDEARTNAGIEATPAGPGTVDVTLSLPGEIRLNPETMAHVTPRVSGTVKETKKALGDVVKHGDVLALLESRELAEITREAAASAERLKLAEANFQRLDKLFKEGVAAEKDYLTAKQAFAEAKIDKESAAQMLGVAGSGGAGTAYALRSPIDGVIIEKHLTIGEVVKDDADAFVVADMSTVWAMVTVYPKDLGKIAVGQKVRLRAEGIEAPLDGQVSFIAATARGDSRATEARVVLSGAPPSWRPGMFVTADVAVESVEAAVALPEEAIQLVEGRPTAFVDDGDKLEARTLKLGRAGFSNATTPVVEVLSGVEAKELVVTRGAFFLKAELGKSEAGHED